MVRAIYVTKPYKFMWFGGIHGPKPYKFIGLRWVLILQIPVMPLAPLKPYLPGENRHPQPPTGPSGGKRKAAWSGNNQRYVFIYPFIIKTIVDIGPFRTQIDKHMVDFGVRGASWGVLAPPGRPSN